MKYHDFKGVAHYRNNEDFFFHFPGHTTQLVPGSPFYRFRTHIYQYHTIQITVTRTNGVT